FQIVGTAATGKEAVKKVGGLKPDVVLMEINLPALNGKEATQLIKKEYPSVKIIMVTVSDDIVDLLDSIKNGAQGYLLKNMEHGSWIPYIQSIIQDDGEVDHLFATKMLQEFSNHCDAEDIEEEMLSYREREILIYVAKG